VCKVHVQSRKCSKCVKRAQRCNVRVTQSKFTRLAAQKEKLRASIKESRKAQDTAIKAHKKALEDLQVACAQEEQLQQQIDLINRCAEEAIAAEEHSIKEQEQEESEVIVFNSPLEGLGLNLSPSTWSAIEGLLFNYFKFPELLPAS
jgi:hypothetical protein